MKKFCKKCNVFALFGAILSMFVLSVGGSRVLDKNKKYLVEGSYPVATLSSESLDFSNLQKFANLSSPVTFDDNGELTIELGSTNAESSINENVSDSSQQLSGKDGAVRSLTTLNSNATILYATKIGNTIYNTITTVSGEKTTIEASADAQYVLGEAVTGSSQLIYVSNCEYRVLSASTISSLAMLKSSTTSIVSSAEAEVLSLENGTMTIKNSSYTSQKEGARAIYQTGGTLTLENCTFDGFSAPSNEDGGAILQEDGTLNIKGTSTFKNCSAEDGGAIYSSGTLTIDSIEISDCIASSLGGAIKCQSITKITNAIFKKCSSHYGGCIYVDSTATLTLENVTIDSCNAFGNGGAICADGDVTISGTSQLINNSSRYAGGAIISGKTLTITSGTISGNTSSDGGGIYTSGETIISGGIITGNIASNGGGIYSTNILNISGTAEISDNVTGSYTDYSGVSKSISDNGTNGHYVIKYDTTNVFETGKRYLLMIDGASKHNFKNVKMSSYWDENSYTTNVTFDGDFCYDSGVNYKRTRVSDDVEIYEFTVINGGSDQCLFLFFSGAVDLSYADDMKLLVTEIGTSGSGGGIYATGTTTVSGGTITGNTASNYGGGIYATGATTISGGTIAGNIASNGGGIYSESTLNISETAEISDNVTGAYLDYSGVSKSIATNGTNDYYAIGFNTTGIFESGKRYVIEIYGLSNYPYKFVKLSQEWSSTWSGSTFDSLSTESDAPAEVNPKYVSFANGTECIEFTARDISTNHSVYIFFNNSVDLSWADNIKIIVTEIGTSGNGGGIYATGATTIAGGTISGNTVGTYGGGIYTSSTLNISGGTISTNTAPRGSAVFGLSDTTITIGGSCIITQNTATAHGTVYTFGSLSMTGGTISNNTSSGDGGGILLNGAGKVNTISGGTISGNTAGAVGGGICLNYGTLTISNATISGNTAITNGGGIYSAGTLNIISGTISGNSGRTSTATNTPSAGAIYSTGTLTISGGEITNNNSTYPTVFSEGGTTTLSGGNIHDNNTTLTGVKNVYQNGGTLNITGAVSITQSGSTGGGIEINNNATFNLNYNATISCPEYDIYLTSGYITLGANITNGYRVFKYCITSYDDTTNISSIIAYSTNTTYLQSFLNNLKVINIGDYDLAIDGNYLVVKNAGIKVTLNLDGEDVQTIKVKSGQTLQNAIPLLDSSWTSNDENTCGWFLDADLTQVADLTQATTQAMTLYTKKATLQSSSGKDTFTFTKSDDGSCYYISKTSSTYTVGDLVFPNAYKASGETTALPVQIYSGSKYSDGAFYYCRNITSVTLNANCTSVSAYAFYNCNGLISITIPDSITSIDNDGFLGCSSLTSITIGKSVTSIGYEVFIGCSTLTSVYYMSTVEDWLKISFGTSLFGNAHSLYFNNVLAENITIPNSISSIQNNAFHYCNSLKTVTIPDSVSSIGYFAFANCYSLTSITIGNSVTSIGVDAFWYCRSLTNITIPDSVTIIGNDGFQGCSSLTSITIGNSVSRIGSSAFAKCSSLTSIYIPSSVKMIWASSYVNSPFYGCSSSLKIYFGVASKPTSGLGDYWNYYSESGYYEDNINVFWGITRETYNSTYASFSGDGSAVSELVGLSSVNSLSVSKLAGLSSANGMAYSVSVAQIEEPENTVTAYVEQEKKYLMGAVLNKKLFGNDED